MHSIWDSQCQWGVSSAYSCNHRIHRADTPEIFEKGTIEILQIVRRSGLKLNRAKCQFNQRQLTFLGHTISNKGIAQNARKIKAITDMLEPTNQKELQRFLGMITCLGKLLLDLSTKTAPQRTLFGPLTNLKGRHFKTLRKWSLRAQN